MPKEEFSEYIKEADKISPDKKDVSYLALALKLGCALWSNDAALKNRQSKVVVYSTEEMLKIFLPE